MNYEPRTINNEPRTINNEPRTINNEPRTMPVRRSIGEGGNYVQSTTKLCKTNPISKKLKML